MMKKLILIITIMMISLLVGCAEVEEDTTVELKDFKLSVNTWVGFGPFYLAEELGYFEDEGLDVEIIVMEGAAERKSSMVTNRIDALGDTVDLLVLARDQDVPEVAVLEIDLSDGADGLIATEDIKSLADLKGKKVAAQKNFVGESFLLYLLKKNNMSVDDVTIVDTESGAAGAAFVAGHVDAAVSWEPWLSKANERAGGHVVISSADEPGVIVDILTINENVINDRPDEVKALMKGWFNAVNYWENNKEDANARMAKHYNMPVEEFADIISGVKWPGYQENVEYFGTSDNPGKIYEVANTFGDVFLETDSIAEKPDLTKAIDESFLVSLYE
jgi:NitT/TauT family transport system substrate-binding protein